MAQLALLTWHLVMAQKPRRQIRISLRIILEAMNLQVLLELLLNSTLTLIQANWGACQATSQSCYFNSTITYDPITPLLSTCYQGSVPNCYVEVQQVSDVQKTMEFAQELRIPLVVKDTGHDYNGHSSAPNSPALWTHNYTPEMTLTRSFTPDGCSAATGDVVTFGAGQGFGPIYEFANANNVEVVGGTSETVGAAEGWITGGGHSALSNTLGLGVDNV
jgi:hypothetical protein